MKYIFVIIFLSLIWSQVPCLDAYFCKAPKRRLASASSQTWLMLVLSHCIHFRLLTTHHLQYIIWFHPMWSSLVLHFCLLYLLSILSIIFLLFFSSFWKKMYVFKYKIKIKIYKNRLHCIIYNHLSQLCYYIWNAYDGKNSNTLFLQTFLLNQSMALFISYYKSCFQWLKNLVCIWILPNGNWQWIADTLSICFKKWRKNVFANLSKCVTWSLLINQFLYYHNKVFWNSKFESIWVLFRTMLFNFNFVALSHLWNSMSYLAQNRIIIGHISPSPHSCVIVCFVNSIFVHFSSFETLKIVFVIFFNSTNLLSKFSNPNAVLHEIMERFVGRPSAEA